MFSPVESQVIFLSKETPIVSVCLRNAEVPYTNQNKTAQKSEVGQMRVQLFRNISRHYMTFVEKVKVVNPFSQSKRPLELSHIFKSMVFGKDRKGNSFKNRLKEHINWRKVRHLLKLVSRSSPIVA